MDNIQFSITVQISEVSKAHQTKFSTHLNCKNTASNVSRKHVKSKYSNFTVQDQH